MHWTAALVTKMTGSLNEVTVRFPSTFYAILAVLLVYLLGRTIFDGPTALLGGAILATSMVYQDQALSARVDMTLCFFVTAGLALFYWLYHGYLQNPLWFYGFYTVVGVGTLAKGPLSVVLTGLVAASFALVERRWDMIRRFCFHPGVVLMLILATGWYGVAVVRGGEAFFDRQILEENLNRFVGDTGHNHPIHYYLPYLFSQAMPWALFFPLLFWDVVRTGLRPDGDRLFLKLWFLVMFVFFSISVGKRPVYLLPLYPALSLLLAAWFYEADAGGNVRTIGYKAIACFAVLIGVLLLIVTTGALWNQDQGWFFAPIEALLKPKDRAKLMALRNQLDNFGWTFTWVALIEAVLWFFLARSVWLGKMRTVAHQLLLVSLLNAFVGWNVVMPAIAQSQSYRDFMAQVNERVQSDDKLYLYGEFNSDSVIFYRGNVIAKLDQPIPIVAERVGRGDGYLIMTVQSLNEIQKAAANVPQPLLESQGTGPEGDAPLVLMLADVP
jgi:hypothetical protein